MSGKRVNIPRSRKDLHYRYTMPALQAKVEGSGNGVKTKIPNLREIAKDLNRNPQEILKFFGFDLGALTRAQEKNNSYIVNGRYDAGTLAGVLDTFIDRYVLCGKCSNPETLINTGTRSVKLKCISCGHDTTCDPTHKQTDYLIKTASRDIKTKKSRRAEAQKAARRKGKTKSTKKAATAEDGPEEEVVWHSDTSAKAVRARRKALMAAAEEQEQSADVDPEEELNKLLASGKKPSLDDLRVVRDAMRLTPEELTDVIVRKVFDQNILKQVQPVAERFFEFFQAERVQKALMHSVVDYVSKDHEDLLPQLATIIKGLYDEDVLEEERIVEWYEGTDASEEWVGAKLKLAPLIAWLQTAESESSSEED